MSQVKTEEELFERLADLYEEEKKLIHEYNKYIVKKNRKRKKKIKSIAQLERDNDTQCLAILKSKKRCTKTRSKDESHDFELCKLHNNPKFDGKIIKLELPPLSETSSVDSESAEEGSSVDSEEGLINVKLIVDVDGDNIDTDGNIWSMDDQIIIGKKDLRTKQKVYFKSKVV